MNETKPNVLVLGANSDIATSVARAYAEQSCSLHLAARETEHLKELEEDF